MMIFSATISQASFLPPTSPQSNPSLVCHNVDMEIPENRLVVEVAPGTNENPFPFVTVKNDSLNRNSDILFANTVTEQRTGNSILLFGTGLDMEVTGDESGIVLGTVRVQPNGNDIQEYRVNCHVMYYSMPAQAETM
jgi:hypothetical protein